MKRNAMIKGQILKMRGQEEDRGLRMLKVGGGGRMEEEGGGMRGGGGVSVGSSRRS